MVGGPWVTVREDYFGELADVIFVGEAEETWPQFLREWEAGRHRAAIRASRENGHDDAACAALRFAEDAALFVWQRSVFSRLPVSM